MNLSSSEDGFAEPANPPKTQDTAQDTETHEHEISEVTRKLQRHEMVTKAACNTFMNA